MRVLGIDPGYAIVGWGVVDYAGNRFAPVDFGAVCTDAGVPFERRLDATSSTALSAVWPGRFKIDRLALSGSLCSPAPPKGEPLAKPLALRGLPKPLTLKDFPRSGEDVA